MNGLQAALREAEAVAAALDGNMADAAVDVMIAPPATLLLAMTAATGGGKLLLAGQDCHPEPSGAHTGDIAAEMLRDAGAMAVIVGHSERRTDHGETSAVVKAKAEAAQRAGLTAIVCIGETLVERQSGSTLAVVAAQLEHSVPDAAMSQNTVIAYEPVWAIGTGLTPAPEDVAEVHGYIREALQRRFPGEGGRIRILYGGSVKPDNAATLLAVANVDGALVGGASLKASVFLAIIGAYKVT